MGLYAAASRAEGGANSEHGGRVVARCGRVNTPHQLILRGREANRVRVALKVAAGSTEGLRREIESAKRDYRDVLVMNLMRLARPAFTEL
jgi:hypothetical protein